MKTVSIDTLLFLLAIPLIGAVLVAVVPSARWSRWLTGLAGLAAGGMAVRLAVLCADVGDFASQSTGAFVGARLIGHLPLPGLRLGLMIESLTAPLLLVAGLVTAAGVVGTALWEGACNRGTLAGVLAVQALLLSLVVLDGLAEIAGAFVLLGIATTFVPLVALGARPAGSAALRAFAVHRIGDFALIVGLFALHTSLDGLRFESLLAGPPAIDAWARVADVGVFGGLAHRTLWFVAATGVAVAAASRAGLLCWPFLRDLTASADLPGPVAGLVHAALQGAAGILLVRLHAVLALSPEATDGLAWAGVITAVAAGALALAGRDLLRLDSHLLAASAGVMAVLAVLPTTISTLALAAMLAMLAGLGLPWAFASLVARVRLRDPWALGGLEHVLPRLHTTRLLLTASLALLPPLTGWILWEKAFEAMVMSVRIPAVLVVLLAVGGLLIGLASWRAIHLVFNGPKNEGSRADGTAILLQNLLPVLPALLVAFMGPGLALLELPRPLLQLLPLEFDYTGPLRTFMQPSLEESFAVRALYAAGLVPPPMAPSTFIVLMVLVGLLPWALSMLLWHRRKNGSPPPGATLLTSAPVAKIADVLAGLAGRESVVARSVSEGVEVLSRVLAANLVPATLSVLFQRLPAFFAWLVAMIMRGSQSGGAQRSLVLGCTIAAALAWWQAG